MDIEAEYNQILPKVKRLEDESFYILKDSINTAGIKTHSILSRIKSPDSLIRKAHRKQLNDPIKQINDILGLRVITLLRSDLPKISELIKSNFTIVSEDYKIDGKETDSFGYLSNHFIVKIKDEHSGPRYRDLHSFVFEIQCRTIAMDAWATISHYLDYKSDHDVPSELRKDFYALSGLFYVADTHFELFYNERIKSKSSAQKLVNSNFDLELNLDNFTYYLQLKLKDREHCDLDGVSEIIEELNEAGYKNILDIDKVVNAGMNAFNMHEKLYPPASETGMFSDVGVIRTLFTIMDDNFINVRLKKYPKLNLTGYYNSRKFITGT